MTLEGATLICWALPMALTKQYDRNGAGEEKRCARVAQIKAQIITTSDYDREKLQERNKLAGGGCTIRRSGF